MPSGTDNYEHAGTLIHGTLRHEDLIPAFHNKLKELDPERANKLAGDVELALAGGLGGDDPGFADEVTNDLQDCLNECAPEGWYFGAIEGDGSDFGFWRVDS